MLRIDLWSDAAKHRVCGFRPAMRGTKAGSMKTHTLAETGAHRWLMFGRDPERPAHVADTNQIVICAGQVTVLIDPGGIEIFPAFLQALGATITAESISRIIVTMTDPQAASSLPLWRQICSEDLQISVPALTSDLLSHLDSECLLQPISDDGGTIPVPPSLELDIIPAHFLHGPAAYSVYDPVVGVLYTGSIGSCDVPAPFVAGDFDDYRASLAAYHGRWFVSTAARDVWLNRLSGLQIDCLVPHRGPAFSGPDAGRFLDWFASAALGTLFPVTALSSNPLPDAGEASVVQAEPHSEDRLEEFAPEPVAGNNADPAPDGLSARASRELDDAFAELMEEPAPPQTGTPEPGGDYRLVTRSDFDGLVCAVLFEELQMIDDILFVHPNDMQEGRIDITEKDVTTNLPYVPGCHLAFDHHLSEIARLGRKFDNHIIFPDAPSAARVVYDYYGGRDGFPNVSLEMMAAVDQGDSAAYELEDVLNPQGWALLNFIMDSRSGLGRFKGFRIPNYELMMSLIEYCSLYSIDEILKLPDVKERVELFLEQQEEFKAQLIRCTTMVGNLAVIDLLDEDTVHVGNRFMVYALFPQCNISMHCMWGRDRQNVVYAVGKSIFDKSSTTNVGELMLQYGGGGHHAAGTCQADPLLATTVRQALIQKINADG